MKAASFTQQVSRMLIDDAKHAENNLLNVCAYDLINIKRTKKNKLIDNFMM